MVHSTPLGMAQNPELQLLLKNTIEVLGDLQHTSAQNILGQIL
jgi:hypothetical protein